MDLPVKYFDSTMAGATQLQGVVGSCVDVLKSFLVDGFGGGTTSAFSIASEVATVTLTGHGFDMTGGVHGPVLLVEGATPAEVNGEWRLASVLGANQFTMAMPGVANGTPTGTITVKRAPLGWTRPYSGTNKAVFLPKAAYAQQYLRVLDDSTVPTAASGRWAKLRGYESMSDVDTGVNLFPTVAQVANSLSLLKSSTSDATTRAWWAAGDGGIFYFGTFWHATYPTLASCYIFGDPGSLRSGDLFNGFICADQTDVVPTNPGAMNLMSTLDLVTATQNGKYFARPYLQVGSSSAAGMFGDNAISTYIGGGGVVYPHPVDSGLLFAPVGAGETSLVRTRAFPGLYQPLHVAPLVHLDLVTSIPDLPGRTLRAFNLAKAATAAQCLIDITGPWR